MKSAVNNFLDNVGAICNPHDEPVQNSNSEIEDFSQEEYEQEQEELMQEQMDWYSGKHSM